MSLLYSIDELVEVTVVKRPSKHIKSPYVADVLYNGKEYLAHTPSLGCCGLADTGATIMVAPSKNKSSKCDFTTYLSKTSDKEHSEHHTYVGIHPKLAEHLAEQALKQNLLHRLQNVKSYRRETSIQVPEHDLHSRFDFSGIDQNGTPFLMEIKNVPLADYEDISAKERKTKNYLDRSYHSKVAYFPDGYRKKANEPVSPRALKHIRELTKIRQISKTRTILAFVVQRDDATSFTTSILDEQYKQAVKEALAQGVEIFVLAVQWNKDGQAHFITDHLSMDL